MFGYILMAFAALFIIRILMSIGVIGWICIVVFLLYVAGGGFETKQVRAAQEQTRMQHR